MTTLTFNALTQLNNYIALLHKDLEAQPNKNIIPAACDRRIVGDFINGATLSACWLNGVIQPRYEYQRPANFVAL